MYPKDPEYLGQVYERMMTLGPYSYLLCDLKHETLDNMRLIVKEKNYNNNKLVLASMPVLFLMRGTKNCNFFSGAPFPPHWVDVHLGDVPTGSGGDADISVLAII